MGFISLLLFLGLVGVVASPVLVLVHVMVLFFAPSFILSSPQVLVFLVYLITSTMHIMLGGVPAAIVERVLGPERAHPWMRLVWLGAVAALAIPGFISLIELGAE